MAKDGTTHPTPPLSGNSAAAWSATAYSLSAVLTYIACNLHIWWSFPYPPPGDAGGSLQLGLTDIIQICLLLFNSYL